MCLEFDCLLRKHFEKKLHGLLERLVVVEAHSHLFLQCMWFQAQAEKSNRRLRVVLYERSCTTTDSFEAFEELSTVDSGLHVGVQDPHPYCELARAESMMVRSTTEMLKRDTRDMT